MTNYELAEAFFRPHIPRGDLSRFVQFIWIARGRVPHQRERVLPNGVIELIINLGGPHNVLERDDYSRRTVYRDCWLAGIQSRHLVIESLYDTDLIGIRFKPGGAYAFFGMPLSEVTDQVVEFDLIDRALCDELRGRVLQAKDDAARIECIERTRGNVCSASSPDIPQSSSSATQSARPAVSCALPTWSSAPA